MLACLIWSKNLRGNLERLKVTIRTKQKKKRHPFAQMLEESEIKELDDL